MAAIALGALVAGGAVGAGPLTAVAVIATTVLDQALILPALFPTPDPEPPTLQDIELQTVAEGSPLNRFYGDQVRVSGHMIWRTEPVAETTSGGGKGFGPKAKRGSQDVFGNVAIAFGIGHPLARLVAMWADEKLVYHETIGTEVKLDGSTHELLRQASPHLLPAAGIDICRLRRKTAVDPGEDLGQFRFGQTVNIHGVNPSLNTGGSFVVSGPDVVRIISVLAGANPEITFRPVRVPSTQHNLWLTTTEGALFTRATFSDPNFPLVTTVDPRVAEFDEPWNPAEIQEVRVYPGSETQKADTLIEATEGVGNVEAYRGVAYVVLERFKITEYGNRYPNMTAIWSNNKRMPFDPGDGRGAPTLESVQYNLQNALVDVVTNSGIPQENIDVRKVRLANGKIPKLTGLSVRGTQTTTKILQPLIVASQLMVQEDNGVLKFFLRTRADTVTVAAADLAAHEDGSKHPPLLDISDTAESKAPSSIEVHFNDEDAELQPGHVRHRRIDHVIDNITAMSLPITMKVEEAQDIARAHLWTVLANRQGLKRISLPPSYMRLAEGDRLSVTAYGETFTFLITKVDRGENFLIVAEGVMEVPDTLLFADAT